MGKIWKNDFSIITALTSFKNIQNWLVVWNSFIFPDVGNNDPN